MNKRIYLSICLVILAIVLLLIGYGIVRTIQVKDQLEKNNVQEKLANFEEKDQEISLYTEQFKELHRKPASYQGIIPIYMYHSVRDDLKGEEYPENRVKVASFREQVKYLVENNFDIIFVEELEKVYRYKKPVLLTFDDGYVDFYTTILPILKEYNVKATLFVMPNFIKTNANYCNLEQMKEIKESGLVSIQPHTLSHPRLTDISLTLATSEIIDSKKYLEENLGITCNVFCYPYGVFNKSIENIVKDHYTSALDMLGGIYDTNKHSKYHIPRIYVNRSMTLATFKNYANKSSMIVNW